MDQNFSIFWGTRQIRRQQVALYLASAVKMLKGMGVKPSDIMAVCDDNSVEYVILLLALWQMGALAAPISPRWPPKTIEAYAGKINARKTLYAEDIRRLVCFDARHPVEPGPFMGPDLQQQVTIIATSGSGGEAKAAVHTWGNHYYSAKGSQTLIPLAPSDRWLLSLPLCHISGVSIVARCLVAGASVVIEGEDIMSTIERSGVTHVSLVATQLHRLLENSNNHPLLRSLKAILLGGSAVPAGLLKQAADSGLNVFISYGLTEMSSQVATGKVAPDGRACVKVLPYRHVKISPEGEILARGEVLFQGYITGTRLPLVPMEDSWFATGDMGQMSPEGCLMVTGRKDSMFISGGENIHPEEIERVLLDIPGVCQAVVVAKDDKEFGQRPMAFVQFKGKPLPNEQLVEWLERRLPRFKVPVAFLPWPEHLINRGIKISRQDFLKALPRR